MSHAVNTHHSASCYIDSANMPTEQTYREHSHNNTAKLTLIRFPNSLKLCNMQMEHKVDLVYSTHKFYTYTYRMLLFV